MVKNRGRVLRNSSKKYSRSMIAMLDVLRSVGKVGVKPREGKAVNAKIRVKSFQQHMMVNSVEGPREVTTDHVGEVTVSTYVGNIIEDVGESSFGGETRFIGGGLKGREVGRFGNIRMNPGKNESL